MQEFESISASSYDPSALATKLTAKAAEGWSVVAIVPTGGDVTAFLTRDKGGADEASKPAEASESTADKADKDDDDGAAPVLPAKTEAGAEAAAEPKSEPVSEPSGWAIAPESSSPSPTITTLEPTGVQPVIGGSTTPYEPSVTPTYDPSPASTPASASPASVTPATATPAAATPAAATPAAATPEPAAAPAVPAGWYADPAARFELRYWDGSTWTEHVSRAGQQFTDPPVA
jgi:hypothetical protein